MPPRVPGGPRARSARCRSAGARTGTSASAGRTSSSAGSAAAGPGARAVPLVRRRLEGQRGTAGHGRLRRRHRSRPARGCGRLDSLRRFRGRGGRDRQFHPFPLAGAVASGQSVGQTTEPLGDAADARSPTPRSGRGMAPAARAGCSPHPPRQSAAPQTRAWQRPTGQAPATIRPASSSQPVSRGPESAGSQNKPSIASRPIATTRRSVTASDRRTVAAGRDEYPVQRACEGVMISVQSPPTDPGWPAGRPSMRRRTPYPAGRKPACSQNGRDNGLAVSKSTETHW